MLEKLQHLTHLKLNWCTNITDLSISKIFEVCRELTYFGAQGLKYFTDGGFK